MNKKTIAYATGGTGGHIFPACSLAQGLRNQYRNICFIDKKGGKFVESYKEFYDDLFFLPVINIEKGLKFFQSIYLFFISFFLALFLLKKHQVKLIIGFGGNSSLPPILAAILLNIPVAIHEQNAVLGKANKLISKISKNSLVFLSFAQTLNAPSRAIYTGNIVREKFFHPPKEMKKDQFFNLVVLGGSQGSRKISTTVIEAIALLTEDERKILNICHQSRREEIEEYLLNYSSVNNLIMKEFFQNIDEIITQSHLVISRAGATTLAEFALLQKDVLLIPIPHSIHNHQYLNGVQFLKTHHGTLLEEKDLTPLDLAKILKIKINHYKNNDLEPKLLKKGLVHNKQPSILIIAQQIRSRLKS